jgi:hypothetical protein
MSFRLHTRNLTAGQSMTLGPTDGVLMISYQMSSGAGDNGTLEGNMDFKCASDSVTVASQPLAIAAGGGNVFVSPSTNAALEAVFTCVQGTLKVIIGF